MSSNKKKFQVFVSSTYEDLKEERQAAVDAILSAGHIPAGMELFTAGDESQMKVIKRWIKDSDVFLLILGGRYGSIEPTSKKSYIHLEYEYALRLNIPHFSVVIKDKALDKKVMKNGLSVLERNDPEKLKKFKELVTSKLVKFFEDSKDIKLAIISTLTEFEKREKIEGWIRSSLLKSETEFKRLRNENTKLRKKNNALVKQNNELTNNMQEWSSKLGAF